MIIVIYTNGISNAIYLSTQMEYRDIKMQYFGKMRHIYCKATHISLHTLWHHVFVSEKNGTLYLTKIVYIQ